MAQVLKELVLVALTIAFVLLMATACVLSIFAETPDQRRIRCWKEWALENGYAHYDAKTGDLIRHTKTPGE